MPKLGIYGTGGFSLEVFDIIKDSSSSVDFNISEDLFFIDDFNQSEFHLGFKIVKQKEIDFSDVEIVIAMANAENRKKIVSKLPKETKFASIIHPSSFISPSAKIGTDIIISHHCIVSSEVEVKSHSHLNYHTCIGHETVLQEYFTSAPGVKISANCKIGQNVYFGTNSSAVQGIKVSDNIKVGIGAVVMSSLRKPGTYLFNPAKKVFS